MPDPSVSPADTRECHICHRRLDEPGEMHCSAGHPVSPADTIRRYIKREYPPQPSSEAANQAEDAVDEWEAERVRDKQHINKDATDCGPMMTERDAIVRALFTATHPVRAAGEEDT